MWRDQEYGRPKQSLAQSAHEIDDVHAIRDLYLSGMMTYAELGEAFGVCESAIGCLVRGATYAWVAPVPDESQLRRMRVEHKRPGPRYS